MDKESNQNTTETRFNSPPTDEAMASSPHPLITYHDLGVALQNLQVEIGAQEAEIIYVQENVQIYFISADGSVTAPAQPETLKIISLEQEDGDNLKIFLQVGGWIYPLIPGVSPCYRAEKNTFILPDVHSSVKDSSVGLVFPEEAGETVFELLEDILQTVVTRSEPKPAPCDVPQGYTPSISQRIVTGAQWISNGLMKSAHKVSEHMNSETPKLIEKINPDPTPTAVNPKVTKGIQVAKNVTGTAVQVTGYIASKIGTATVALGKFLAPHIQSQGTRLLSSTCNYTPEEASKKMDNVLDLAAGTVVGFGTVYEGLEKSAGLLATSLANNTVKVVEHKYGAAVGEATGDGLQVVGNALVAGHTIKHLAPKGMAKVAAKATGRAAVQEYRASLREDKNDMNGPGPSTEMK